MEDFIKRGKSEKVDAKTGKNFQSGGKFFQLARIYIPGKMIILTQETPSGDKI